MRTKILCLLIIFPFIAYSQKLERTDLIGNWKFIYGEKNTKIKNDSLSKKMTAKYGIEIIVSDEEINRSDIEITSGWYKDGDLISDYWKVSENGILVYRPVPKDKLDYYKKYTVGVIEQLDNDKYYFAGPILINIISLKDKELVIVDNIYNLHYELN